MGRGRLNASERKASEKIVSPEKKIHFLEGEVSILEIWGREKRLKSEGKPERHSRPQKGKEVVNQILRLCEKAGKPLMEKEVRSPFQS